MGAELLHADGRTNRQTEGRDETVSLLAIFPTLLKILRSAHTVHVCVLCGLFPYTTLTDWFV